jgi:hypothetical protein
MKTGGEKALLPPKRRLIFNKLHGLTIPEDTTLHQQRVFIPIS